MKLLNKKAVGSILKSGFDGAKKFCSKHSHLIAACIGIAGVAGTGYFAYKARPKMDKILDDAEEQLNELDSEAVEITEEEYKKRKRTITFNTFKKSAAVLAPVILSGATASGTIIFNTNKVIKIGKQLIEAKTLQNASDLAYAQLYDKTKEIVGEEEAQKIQQQIDQDMANKQFGTDISDETADEIFDVAIQARGGNQLYYDPQFGMLFKSDDDTLNRATDELVGDLKRRKDPEQYISYNKWLSQIDYPGVIAGEDYAVAWYDQAYTQYAYTNELEITGLELNLNNTVKIGKRAVTVIHWRDRPVWVQDLKPKRH